MWKLPSFNVGDRIVVKSPRIIVDKTDNFCIQARAIVPLSHGISFRTLGLTIEEDGKGYVQCLDPGRPHTDAGTVLFEIKRERT